ncbi:hypothetical protein A2335_05005 [Candidatus Peregrinibacteria bacterium RIFOXYB2_FULL_32_7]|nr:MAG: hypothetical protein A2335_05005 [Candidatus Peregrinibacteria bacterium RIFOXYB2_FULL_32_7]
MNIFNKKANPWMISTLVFAGIFIGVVLIQALNYFSDEEALANKQQIKEIQKKYKEFETSVDENQDPVLGDLDAPVTIIEYSDFQCPYCERFVTGALPQIEEEYIKTGKVKLIFRDVPLSFHAQAKQAAYAVNCALDQNPKKYWEMHDLVFLRQAEWSGNSNAVSVFKKLADNIGLKSNKFEECLNSGKYSDEIDDDLVSARGAGVTGTPSFAINGELIVGALPFESFKEAIEKNLGTVTK